jgi:hypothetical protein
MMRPRLIARWLVTAVAVVWSASGHAIVVSIDTFSITRNNAPFFTDTFNVLGGGPPVGPNNVAPNFNPAIYGVGGNTPLGYYVLDNTSSGPISGTTLSTAGTGSVLPIDSDNGAFGPNAQGAARRTVVVELLTSVASINATSALTSSNILTATGLFDLAIPTGPLFSAYGIRFSDHLPGSTPAHPGGQLLQLFVRFNGTTDKAEIAYILQDFGAGTITPLGSVVELTSALVGDADQIQFMLSQSSAGGPFSGSYQFFDGGLATGGGTLGSGTLFNDPNFQFVRGEFFVAQGVPEPTTLSLLGLAFAAGLGFSRRRKRH